ncbi:MAG: hypothetical protein REI11_15475, partial [Patulibacter sp.]|nr:hypothetical protein [Patulibacter sp.]
MFRVLPNTVLSRLAAVGLLALTTGLAACGSDDAGNQAAVPAAPATTSDTAATTAVPASTPETTTPLTKAQKKAAAKALAKQQEALKSQAEKTVSKNIPTVTDTPETEKTIEDASARKRSKHRLSDDVDTAETALKKAGQDAKKVKVT